MSFCKEKIHRATENVKISMTLWIDELKEETHRPAPGWKIAALFALNYFENVTGLT